MSLVSPAGLETSSRPTLVPQAAPSGFEPHAFEKDFSVGAPRERAWGWLEDPATFVEGQVWPYRVEFVSVDGNPPGFHVGGLSIHHGPFLHLPGVLTEIREGEYRDLQYFYGSYAISPRLVRPTRLRFWLSEESAPGGATHVRLRLDSFVRRGLGGLWTAGQRVFWSRFPRWMERSCATP
ncbi:MAG: hypothetical protein QNK04_16885 [Myxococcota bacterium]|nr:hypothetical protein [Myxococcota bacterium]